LFVRLPVLALAPGAFAIGTTEFVTMGPLPEMAATLDVSIPSAGWLLTSYALGVVVGMVVAERPDRNGRPPVDAAPAANEPAPRVEAVAA
jgi:predicted MFS family arabinose efflux permease